MDSWRRTLGQFQKLFNDMAPSQRMTLVVLPLLVLAGLGLVMYLRVGPAEEALMYGKTLTPDELKNAQAALQKAGLVHFRVEGQRILVPKTDVARGEAVLLASGDGADEFGSAFTKMFEKNMIFTGGSESQRRDELDFVKSKELRNLLKMIPDVADARIIPDRSRQRGFGARSKVTAVAGIYPRGGRELSRGLAHTVREAVARSFGMDAADVSVFNAASGESVRFPNGESPGDNEYVDAVRKHSDFYEQKIKDALSYIPNVFVNVSVEVENVARSTRQERKYEPKQFPYKTVENTQNETANETGPASEPGVQSNQPRNLRPVTTQKNTRTNEKSDITTESVPVGTKLEVSEIAGFTPKSVKAAISIPKDYYREILRAQGADELDKAAFQTKLQQLQVEKEKEVAQKVGLLVLVPEGKTAADAVSVSSYDRLDLGEAPPTISVSTRALEALSEWGGPVGLALFALVALWMLSRSSKRAPETPAAASTRAAGTKAPAAAPEALEEESPMEPTKRDKLQTLVKDNPEMAASVISRWLSVPK
jgi:flagellar biosynthesis/type III secretory pathway M-ring protein FliF/YscJ